ncbi:MAG: hypothetical protein ACTHZ9_04220 [Leucobacter sp.]
MMRNSARSRRSRVRAAAVGIGLVVAIGVSAAQPLMEPVEAAWTDAEAAETTASALTVEGVPGGLTCTDRGLPLLASYVSVSWNAAPNAARYRVMMRNESGTEEGVVVTTSSLNADITVGLLSGVVDSLLALLLGGGNAYVFVLAEHSSGWVSLPSATTRIGNGILGGISCDN